MLETPNRRIGVFIDVQNMYYSARNIFNRKVNFPQIVKESVGNGQLVRAIAYAVTTKAGEESAFLEALEKQGIEVIAKDLVEFQSGQKKANWDVGIAIDVVRMLDMLDVVVLVSGDGDFAPLADYVRGHGRLFHVVSFRESTSSELLDVADIYSNISDQPDVYLIGEKEVKKPVLKKKSILKPI
ncbi:NYN domain-containing protein [Patescibacteria group bacterium]|nr:NYN domain-containing protein [Patescibacteria group bacterium]MBU4452902.1 NYN domain-containing protein [Patescibacteria group bacterium]MCG2687917.1 NYN domain-containing protein [Candidatus Parcubacteria bacterium]